jgi:hypothetical protein
MGAGAGPARHSSRLGAEKSSGGKCISAPKTAACFCISVDSFANGFMKIKAERAEKWTRTMGRRCAIKVSIALGKWRARGPSKR